MKSILFLLAVLFAFQSVGQNIKLPAPNISGGQTLMQSINDRHSERTFSPEALSYQVLSDLMWVAWGFNREDKRTVPTSMNKQEMEVYCVLAGAVYRYDARENLLVFIREGDVRKSVGKQDYVYDAPLNIVYVAHSSGASSWTDKQKLSSYAHAGSMSQNVYLYCASEKLNVVVRAYFDSLEVRNSLLLSDDELPLLMQTVGQRP